MKKADRPIAIVIHGGAGPDSEYILSHTPEYQEGLVKAVNAGYDILEKGGSALEAVETAVRSLEDNKLFNAGRGSALTASGNVEMCASIMDGKTRKAGAAAIVCNIRNPISFARKLLDDPSLLYVGGHEAEEIAKEMGVDFEPDAYFITENQWDDFEIEREKHRRASTDAYRKYKKRTHGTVGAVALDVHGNLAAGTSTGGTPFCLPGRIGDSSMIGVGTYADNRYAAVSCTGDGEYLITEALSHNIVANVEHTGKTIQEAADYVILHKNADSDGDIGAIGIDKDGNIGMTFNTERMHRAWKTREDFGVAIYKDKQES